MHYVIGDVHGCFDEMTALLTRIQARDPDAWFIFVGDFVDRGPKVIETLTWAMEHISADGRYQAVMGNHEDLILNWYPRYIRAARLHFRIPATQYDFRQTAKKAGWLEPAKVREVVTFFRSLPLRKDLLINGVPVIISHAWVPANGLEDRHAYIWERQYDYQGPELLIHGHTPTIFDDYLEGRFRPGRIGFSRNAVNVDGGRVYASYYPQYPCSLCCICLETMEEYYEPGDDLADLSKPVASDYDKKIICSKLGII
ncbi:MAG: metallophosphoesterase [Lachnospiraceae bacterium]